MPRIDPQQLLNCLSVLLATNGGIRSSKEVNRLVLLMGKFSKKLVSKCIYIQILKSSQTELLGQFMTDGGWTLSHTWLQDGILTRNWPLVEELLELLLLCPVDVQRLKCNSAPKLVKGLSKEGGNEGVRILASKLVEQWLKIVKGETTTSPTIVQPKQDVIVSVLKPELPVVKSEAIESSEDVVEEPVDDDDMVDPLEIPSNHVPQEDNSTKERLAKAKSDGLVFKITVKDGKQVLAKVESSPKKENDNTSEKNSKTRNEPVSKVKNEPIAKVKNEPAAKVKNEPVTKVKNEPITKAKNESVAKVKNEPVAKVKNEPVAKAKNEPVAKIKNEPVPKIKIELTENKKDVKDKIKKEIAPKQENKSEKPKKDAAKEKSKSDEKGSERRNSKESKEKDIRDSKDSNDSKDSKDKDRKKDSSSKSSKHSSSSRSSGHKSSRSSSDSKHKSSSSNRDKDGNKDRSSKSTSSSSRSSSSSSKNNSSSSSSSKLNQTREKRDSLDEKASQSTKDKDLSTKLAPPSINKLGKIPKKTSSSTIDGESSTETNAKKLSISIEIKKDAENRPKTVKTYNSQFRSHGLAEEAPPPPSRRGLLRPSSQPITGTSIPANIVSKRLSPPPEKKDAVIPEKKLKLDIPSTEKPGIKLIPAKPKTPVLVESDMFMDAIFASRTKKDSTRKRKRIPSLTTTSETTKPEKVQSPEPKDSKSVAPKFYQDTLDDNEVKDEEQSEESKGKDEKNDATKEINNDENVKMEENDELNDVKDDETVVVEKKPPGPGCGPDGPPGVLTKIKRKGTKKQLKWRPQESLEEIRYFELDENERVNVSRNFGDMTQKERFSERDAFSIARKMNADDSMVEQIPYSVLFIVDDVPSLPEVKSKEKKIQADRQLTCLEPIYFNRLMIPDSPAEPDMEQYQIVDPPEIPLDDANGNPDGIKNSSNIPWPEPRGSPPSQPSAFDDQQFANFQPNFPYNNQPGWNPPNAIPPSFNGPPNMLNLNSIRPDVMNNINMNPMPPFQQNPNFGPPNGMRHNYGGNFGNNDGRIHPGPVQNNPGWFRPNGPVNQQNNWRPPMGNNNNRPRPEWIPRNVCRAFAKGFCRNGDKCQWLHPGINCPPF